MVLLKYYKVIFTTITFRPQFDVQVSVFLMIFGALVAAFNDLAFNLRGYTYILLNDVCSAGNGVVTKKKLEAKDLGNFVKKRK